MKMECPECGSEMKDSYKKIKFKHPFGKSENTLRVKTKKGRVYHCERCNKDFAITYTLAEVEVIK